MPYLRKNSVCPLASTRWWRGFQYSSTFIILHKLHIVKTISRTLVVKNSKPTLLENSLEQLNIRYKLIKPYTPRHRTSNGSLPSENALTIIFLSGRLTGKLRTTS